MCSVRSSLRIPQQVGIDASNKPMSISQVEIITIGPQVEEVGRGNAGRFDDGHFDLALSFHTQGLG